MWLSSSRRSHCLRVDHAARSRIAFRLGVSEATIKVDEVVKGKKDTTRVTVLFPQSDDIRWHKVHKYAKGQQGIWLLQKGRNQDPEGIAPKVLAAIPPGSEVMTALHAADFQPLNELGRVKALLPNNSHLSARRLP